VKRPLATSSSALITSALLSCGGLSMPWYDMKPKAGAT
jgi:hypothetical protein